MKRIGVLLAAGQSKRMGRPKQLLPWPPKGENPKPLVAAAFDAIARVCDEMVVVVGHQAEDVVAALGDRKFHRLDGDSTAHLFSSIRHGMMAARQLDADAALVIQPADHPSVRFDTLQSLIEAVDANSDVAAMPQYRGRGGHPVIVPPEVAIRIRGYSAVGGLRKFWIDHPDLCVRLPVDDPGVVFDIDTQSDYDFCVQ